MTKKIIIITGTPGTGKTTIAKEISKRFKIKRIDANKLVLKEKLFEGYDRSRKTKIVDVKKLNTFLEKLIKSSDESLIIDSHMSHFLKASLVDLCIVCKCKLPVLKKRLEKRGYSSDKVRENLDAEIFDICLNEAKERKHRILLVDTGHKGAKDIAKLIEF